MKIEIDLNEIFPEVDGCCSEGGCSIDSIAESLKSEITYSVKNSLLVDVREKTTRLVESELKSQLDRTLKIHVDSKIEEILSKAEVSGRYSSDAPVPIQDYCISAVTDAIKSRDFVSTISRIVDTYVDTLKDRFDRVFASALLDKMMKANLLKDDRIAGMLLEQEDINK